MDGQYQQYKQQFQSFGAEKKAEFDWRPAEGLAALQMGSSALVWGGGSYGSDFALHIKTNQTKSND